VHVVDGDEPSRGRLGKNKRSQRQTYGETERS